MRIIAGKYGRRNLQVPKGRDIRPTSDKIRGAIFNALEAQGAIDNAHVLDAFCGTAALGLEALSRGAAQCIFMDKNKTSLDLARTNIESLGADGSCELILGDATTHRFKPIKFDLIFLDPPYHKGLIELTLQNLLKQSLLSPTARIICESERDVPAIHTGAFTSKFELLSEKIYGDTKIEILAYIASTPE